MFRNTLFISVSMAVASAAMAMEANYSEGVFVVNEDWYGHQNSTINHLSPDDPDGEYWSYRVFQEENPGYELGCTSQMAAFHAGYLFVISKQAKDPGASVSGGRITVADASTLKLVKQLELIDPSGAQCDGRSVLGVSETKVYVSASNGVWVFDIPTMSVTGCIAGTESGGKSLYMGQCGSMVMSGGKVFVAHQSKGILVIDPSTDTLTDSIGFSVIDEKAAIGSIVKSADGNVWASVTADINGTGSTMPYIVKIDPALLDVAVKELPEGISAPANSWYAWTPDGFCASAKRNALYWNGGATSWFSQAQIFRYDIDADSFSKIIDLKEQGDGWNVYGCSMRLHPETDELYMSLFVKYADTAYALRRCDYLGNTIKEYPMIANYWFPSIPVFPQSGGASGIDDSAVDQEECDALYYDLQGCPLGSSAEGLRGIVIKRQGGKSVLIRL